MINSKLFFLSFVAFMFIILFGACRSVKVENNERGVIFKKFDGGIDTSKVYLPGKHNIARYDWLIIYDVDPRFDEDIIEVLSKDNIKIEVEIVYSFKPIPEKIALLHYYTGADFQRFIVEPEINRAATEYFKNLLAAKVVSNSKEVIGEEMFRMAEKTIKKGHVELESILIKNIIIH